GPRRTVGRPVSGEDGRSDGGGCRWGRVPARCWRGGGLGLPAVSAFGALPVGVGVGRRPGRPPVGAGGSCRTGREQGRPSGAGGGRPVGAGVAAGVAVLGWVPTAGRGGCRWGRLPARCHGGGPPADRLPAQVLGALAVGAGGPTAA